MQVRLTPHSRPAPSRPDATSNSSAPAEEAALHEKRVGALETFLDNWAQNEPQESVDEAREFARLVVLDARAGEKQIAHPYTGTVPEFRGDFPWVDIAAFRPPPDDADERHEHAAEQPRQLEAMNLPPAAMPSVARAESPQRASQEDSIASSHASQPAKNQALAQPAESNGMVARLKRMFTGFSAADRMRFKKERVERLEQTVKAVHEKVQEGTATQAQLKNWTKKYIDATTALLEDSLVSRSQGVRIAIKCVNLYEAVGAPIPTAGNYSLHPLHFICYDAAQTLFSSGTGVHFSADADGVKYASPDTTKKEPKNVDLMAVALAVRMMGRVQQYSDFAIETPTLKDVYTSDELATVLEPKNFDSIGLDAAKFVLSKAEPWTSDARMQAVHSALNEAAQNRVAEERVKFVTVHLPRSLASITEGYLKGDGAKEQLDQG